jgi:hypothetical protein
MSFYVPSVFAMPNTVPWHYKWVEINLRLHSFIRYKMEDTLDNMGRPYTETLAYVQEVGDGTGWEWRAFRHVDDKVTAMDIPSPQQYYKITLQVEELIRKELD